ncbi:hypothetical protein V1273_003797 [Bradyrhizobium sp. AZCC 1721]
MKLVPPLVRSGWKAPNDRLGTTRLPRKFLPRVNLFDFAQGRLMKELSALELAIASSLMAGAMQAAMLQSMVRNNLITAEEGHEIYEQALLMLETNQTMTSSPDVFEAARELIEQHLRSS